MTRLSVLHVHLSRPSAPANLRGNALKLEDAKDGIEAKWVQVAVEGEFLGYGGPDHPGFEITRRTFEEVIANLRSHPSFHMGPDGFGDEGVIPWDFSHASEQRPTEGSMPMVGAPSQGWSSDAQIRNGASGKAELWMLTKFGEPARTYVLSGQYKWASVALAFESVDNVSGKPTGAVITSIALTNRPFIEGMAQLAAEKTHGAPPASPDNTVEAAKAAKENATMEILKVLAALLGVTATQEAITAELESLTGLRDKLVSLFAMAPSKATTTAILQFAVDSHKGAETLKALCGALSVADGNEAINSVSALQVAHAELEKLKPELLALQKVQEEAEKVEIAVDVDRALASNSAFDESMRPMFELSRKADKEAFLAKYPAGAAPAATASAQLTQSVAATTAGVQLAVQPTPVGAAAVTVDAHGNMQRPAAPVQAAVPAATGVLGGQAVNLSMYPGINDTQRMVAHLTATRPGFKNQTWDDQFEAACLALAELKKAAA